MFYLKKFSIIGLHGYINIDLKIKKNTLVLVSENGAGKTTILRMLYDFISKDWKNLAKFNFKEIKITIASYPG